MLYSDEIFCSISHPGIDMYYNEELPLLEKDLSLQDRESSVTVNVLQYFTNCLFLHKDTRYDATFDVDGSLFEPHQRLIKLRGLMKEHNIGVYIVPSQDQHQNERTADIDKRLEFITGFTGGFGVAVIALNDPSELSGEAALSTDGRYFLQADIELEPDDWTLLKQNTAGYPAWTEYAVAKAKESSFSNVISCDPRVLDCISGEYFASEASKGKVKFKPLWNLNLVDKIWGTDRPPLTVHPIYHLGIEYSGETVSAKLKRVRNQMIEEGLTHLIITDLGDIAWLFNLRCDGNFDYVPFFHSFTIVSLTDCTLYCNDSMLTQSLEFIKVKWYDNFYSDLKYISAANSGASFGISTNSNYAVRISLQKSQVVYKSIVSYMKIYKNATELKNYAKAQTYDSLSFIKLAAWLEHELIHKKTILNEYEVVQKLYSIQKQTPTFKSHSNAAISSSGANASIIHYAPSREFNSLVNPDELFLLDSGAQYLEGTTDITRTFKFGKKSLPEDKKFYTLVLKGHLNVALAKYPAGAAAGTILDAFSREPLWERGLDFNHGTGHGVGSFGNIHEGPLFILTTSTGPCKEPLFKPGGIVTIEPGYYVDGVKGFRIESELEIVELESKDRLGNNLLEFKYLTKIPFCRSLIDTSLLSQDEIEWINRYHQSIREEFSDIEDKITDKWLKRETEPI